MNPGSLETLLREHDWMRRLARQLVADSAAADDLVQQAWSDLLQSHARIDPERGVRGFLATILRRGATKRKLEDARRARRESIVPPGEPLPSPESIVSEVETQRAVVDAVLELDEPYRETVILRWWKDKSVAEIARERSLTHDAVETRLKRAHAKLREALARRHGGDPRRAAFSLMPLAIAAKPSIAIPAGGTLAATGVIGTLGAIVMSKALVATGVTAIAAIVVALNLRGPSDASPSESSNANLPTIESNDPNVAAGEGPAVRIDRDAVLPDANPTPNADADAPLCRVRVRDADGNAVPNAFLLFDTPDGIVQPEPTDAAGETSTPRRSLDCDAYVFAPARAPSRYRVALGSDSIGLTLDRGVSIEGTVLVDDAPPGERTIVVAYYPDRPFAALESAPAAVFAQAKAFHRAIELEFEVEPSGRFCFRGLTIQETGVLIVRSPYLRNGNVDDNAWKRTVVRAPAAGIVIRTVGEAIVRGRVLDAESNPAPHVRIEISSQKRNSASTGYSVGATRDDGTFRVPHWEGGQWFTVTAEDREGDRVSRRFPGPLPRDCALGDLVLERAVPIRFRAVDGDDNAISDAIAFVLSDPRRKSDPTGADGRGSILLAPSLRAEPIVAYAPGFDGASFTQNAAREGAPNAEHVVVLSRATRLEVSLGPPGAEWPPRRSLCLMTTGARAIERRAIDLAVARASAFGGDGGTSEDAVCIDFPLDENNRATIERLTPGVTWELSLYGVSAPLTPRTITLEPGESRTIEVVTTEPLHTISGLVRDVSGAPISHAMVFPITRSLDGRYVHDTPSSTTDGAGRFRIIGLSGNSCDLEVVRTGFARKHVSDVDLTNDPDSLEIVIEAGRELRCLVVDANDQPVRRAAIELFVEGRDPDEYSWTPLAGEAAPGVYSFWTLLFSGPQRGRVDLSGLRYEIGFAANESETTVRVPVMGSLVVHRDFAIDGFAHRMWLIDESTGREQAIPEILVDPGQTTSDETIEHVLPGRYRVVVKRKGNDDDAFREIARAENVVVEAGLRATATLSQTRSPR